MSKLPVIAIIDPLGRHGGFHYYVDGAARGLAAAGHEVHVYVTSFTGVSGSGQFEERVAFGDIYGKAPTYKRALRYFVGLVRALWWAWQASTKVVYLHAFHHDFREMAAVWGARALGMKVILTVHDIESFGFQRSRLTKRAVLAGGSALVFQNAYSKLVFESVGKYDRRKSAIVPHGHYCDAYPHPPSRKQARQELALNDAEFIFLFFGNPREEKGLDLLIRALSALKDLRGWRLLVAGKMKSPQEEAIRKLIVEAGLQEFVLIDAHHISDEKAAAYYRASNVVVIPYRRIYESGVAIMAMSMARAALVSDLEPLTDKIAANETGFVFACDDEAALSSALGEVFARRAELDDMGSAGLRKVLATRDWKDIGRALSRVACELCV